MKRVSNFYEQTNWLWKFLNPATQPPLMKEFFDRENNFLLKHIRKGKSVFAVGCGFGRHLKLLASIIANGTGVDIDKKRIYESKFLLQKYPFINTFVGDASNLNTIRNATFDYVICMNNTFGNLYDKKIAALKEMKRIVKDKGEIIISVYSSQSISERVEWYRNTGLSGIKIRGNFIYTQQGFKSEHFTKKSLQKLFKEVGLKGAIKNLNKVSYICLLSKV